MGKYPNSDIHAKYSDFHWNLALKDRRFKRLYCADLDRLWVEYSFTGNAVIAIIDIKKISDLHNKSFGLTSTENGIYTWFEDKGAFVFLVYVRADFNKFVIKPFNKGLFYIIRSAEDYGEWLLSLRVDPHRFLNKLQSYSLDEFLV